MEFNFTKFISFYQCIFYWLNFSLINDSMAEDYSVLLVNFRRFYSADTFYHNESVLYLETTSLKKSFGEVLAFFKDYLYNSSLQASAALVLEHTTSLLYIMFVLVDFPHLLFLHSFLIPF